MSRTTCRNGFIFIAAVCLGSMVTSARGGNLDDPGAPTDPASAMYTAQDLYNRLAFGTNAPKRAGAFTEPTAGPTAGTMPTMDEIMAKAPATNVDGAVDGAVLSGKTFWGLTQGAWGTRTGTIATVTLSPANDTVSNGYYEATTLHAVDADLAANNIRSGVTIFGFAGDTNVVDTSSGNAAAGDVKSGQVAWVQGAAVTGTIATMTLSGTTTNMAAGYYAATNLAQVATNLATANIKAGMSIFGVAGDSNVVDTSTGNAVAGDVRSGRVAWVQGAAVTGMIATVTLSGTTTNMAAGYYAATNLALVATNLATANIKAGMSIFGVPGDTNVVDTSTGNAVAGDVRSGQVAWVQGAAVTGTIATRALSPANDTVSNGYYEATILHAVDTDLATNNIRSGVTIFGFAGDANVVDTSSGNAAAGDVKSGKVVWVQGAAVTGTIAARTLSPANDTVSNGYYEATTLHAVDADLATNNIRSGVTIFGFAGNTNVVDTSSGNAAAGDVRSGQIAWVQGAAVTGTIATVTLSGTTTNMAAGFYAATNLAQVDTNLATANVKAGMSIFGVAGDSNVVDTSTGNASAGDVRSGQVAWVQGAAVTGTIATVMLSGTTTNMAAGYYAATNLAQVATNLTEGNIKKDMNIFGVVGTYEGSGTNARVQKTGQTNSYANYDDGWYSTNKGVKWPKPRFSPVGTSGEETNQIRDNLTGLIWARHANIVGSSMDWQSALDYIAYTINVSEPFYGGTNDWRLPNLRELFSLINIGYYVPALCNTEGTAQWTEGDPFINVVPGQYWTSSAYSPDVNEKWYVIMGDGEVSRTSIYNWCDIWPVRGP